MKNTIESRVRLAEALMLSERLHPDQDFTPTDGGGLQFILFANIDKAIEIRRLYPECIKWTILEKGAYYEIDGILPGGGNISLRYVYRRVEITPPVNAEEWVLDDMLERAELREMVAAEATASELTAEAANV